MKTYKVPVTFFVKAPSRESAEGTLLGALGYLEDNAKVSGGGTPSAALPGYAGDNNNGET